jgi:hypothetical protein
MNVPIDDADLDLVRDLIRLEQMGALEVEHDDEGQARFRPTKAALEAMEATTDGDA